MTLIAAITPLDVPMLIADVLVSDLTTAGKEIELPTAGGSLNVHGSRANVALYLHQKLCIVRDYLAFAAAGDVMKAVNLRNELRNFTGASVPTPAALVRFIDEGTRAGSIDSEFSFVLLLQNRAEGFTYQFGQNVVRARWPASSQDCLFAGSGTQGFAQALALNSELMTRSESTWFRAVSSAGGLVSQLLAQELHAMRNAGTSIRNPLIEFYGAAYEMAYASSIGFVKVPSTQLFWRGGIRDGQPYVDPIDLVVNRSYDGDTLVLRWGRPVDRRFQTRIQHAEQTCIAVPATISTAASELPRDAWPKFGTMLEFHSIEVDGPDGSSVVIVPCLDLQGRYPDVQFTEEADATVVTVPLSTQQKLAVAVSHQLRFMQSRKKAAEAPPVANS
jgi:hypothetical protein